MKSLFIFLILMFFIMVNVNAKTIINEIMYNPSGNDDNKEFVEIFSDEINNFENYTIEDLSGEKDILELVKNFNSSYSLIVENNFDYSSINISIYIIGNNIGNGLNNDKDLIILRNPENKIVDSVNYYSDFGSDGNGKSLERINFNGFSSDPRNWIESNVQDGTPGKENSIKNIDFNSIKINEFLPDPLGNDDASMPQGEFVEIYNNADDNVDLNNFYLEDKFGHKIKIDNIHSLTTIIESKSHLTVYSNGFSGFLNNDEDEIKLFYNNILLDKVSYSSSKEDFSWSKINNKWVLTNPTPNENNDQGIIINKSFVKILEVDESANFGGIIEVKLDIYKGDTRKNAIYLFIEDNDYKISEEVNFNLFGKYVNYTINVPVQIFPNCDLKYKDGKYELKVSGLEENDKKEIKISGITKKLCNINENKVKSDDIYFELMEFPKETTQNQDIITKVRLINNSTDIQSLDLWSYIYKGKTSISGDFDENLKKIRLNPNQEIIVELKNKIDIHAEPDDYKLRVKLKKESRKTADDFTTDIKIINNNENITNKLTDNTIYESSDIKAKNTIPYILIITLILLILILIFRKGL